ncbi:hypothetical protein V8C44DRAFT_337214 [Trichoderma aethiopicum]
MFRPRIRSRLLQRYESQLSRQMAHTSKAMTMTRRVFSTNISLHKGPSPPSSAPSSPAPRITSTSAATTTTTTTTGSPPSLAGQGKEAEGEALRTAEMRESALRAARLRRAAQRQDRRAEEARAAEERREYKRRYDGAARRWVSTIIALPILLVTSYYLFDRLVLGKKPKSLEKYRGEKAD